MTSPFPERDPAIPSLFIDEQGDEGGVPAVLLHSSGLSGRQFRRLAGTLAGSGLRVLSPDLTGHGRSPALGESETFSFARDVAWLVQLLAQRGPAHLIGHSYGAFIALQAARQAPASVRSLTLFEPVAFGVLDPALHPEARRELESVDVPWGQSGEGREAWLRAFVEYWGGAGAWDALREEARADFRRVGWAVREGVRSLAVDRTPASAYGEVRAPVTLLTGENSPRSAREVVAVLAAALPGATAVTIPGAGHMAPLTHADAVNAAIAAALERARARP